jgi:hypothetical protein
MIAHPVPQNNGRFLLKCVKFFVFQEPPAAKPLPFQYIRKQEFRSSKKNQQAIKPVGSLISE